MPTQCFKYDGFMKWACVIVAMASLATACTKDNKQRECMDGTCTTPDFPFCDITGFASGEADTCVAVTCTPDKFGECRGEQEVRCNGAGTNFDVIQCERGCDPSADGCRLCNPGETACTNGKVATCDANGAVVSSTECILGCFEGQPRCHEVNPANGLGTYLDMVSSPPDVELVDASLDPSSGAIMDVNGPVSVPNFLVPAPQQGAPIRVFLVHNARIQRLSVGDPRPLAPGPAVAIVATGDIRVTGLLQVFSSAGSLMTAGCAGASGVYAKDCLDVVSGAGGGAHATHGARGGDVIGPNRLGGNPGIASGTTSLQPSRTAA